MTCNNADKAGLEFFSRISASMSHEIKNVMAIINESAGLLEDLTLMAEKGIPTNPQKLKTLAGRISNQIRRGDTIVKNLNRLAHSVEDMEKEIELSEIIEFTLSVTERIAAARGIAIEFCKTEIPVKIKTRPFFLQTLVYACLDFAMTAMDKGKKMSLIVEPSKIRFIGLDRLSESAVAEFSNNTAKPLFAFLNFEFISNSAEKEICIKYQIESGEQG